MGFFFWFRAQKERHAALMTRPAKGDVDVKHLLHYSLTKDGSTVKAEPVPGLGV